jgi:acyl carrier protein phosphodiesterase
MISDFVKGKKQYDYPPEILRGVKLHRAIDEFTDAHEATRQAKEFFRPAYRLYAGAFVDVVYDHFLAADTSIFHTEEDLQQTAANTYAVLQEYFDLLPQRFQSMLPYMQQQNWLYNYRFYDGIKHSLNGLVRRSAYLTDSATAYGIFEKEYDSLKQCYANFFPTLKNMATDFIDETM